jgi:hypothetical protein
MTENKPKKHRLILACGLLLALLGGPLPIGAQTHAELDYQAQVVPWARARSIESLAQYLSDAAPDDAGKLRLIYAWIAQHIDYEDEYPQNELWATQEYVQAQRAAAVLQNRQAVCQGYANLFCALAREMGIPCEVLTGIVKEPDGTVPRVGHAWAAAPVAGAWQLFDPTWAVPPSGATERVIGKYFMPPPAQFVLSHLPDDPMWQLLDKPVSEQQFREMPPAELADWLASPPDLPFSYRDSLRQWLLLDSSARMLSMEHRVLRLNGGNERAIFGLGQRYWGQFLDGYIALDSLTDAAILNDTLRLDSSWVFGQIAALAQCNRRARGLFDRLSSPERLEKASTFYNDGDVATLLAKLAGAFWTSRADALCNAHPTPRSEAPLDQMRDALLRADSAYARAERSLDPAKLAGIAAEIWHNRSLGHIRVAQRELYFMEALLNAEDAAQHLPLAEKTAETAMQRLHFADADVSRMLATPPVFQFVEERRAVIQQTLTALRLGTFRAARIALMPELHKMLDAAELRVEQAEKWLKNTGKVQKNLQQLFDAMSAQAADFDKEFQKNILLNLQNELFVLQFNSGNLRYRLCAAQWRDARQHDRLPQQRTEIRQNAQQALANLKGAQQALEGLAKGGALGKELANQKTAQVQKLRNAVQELLDAL